MEEYKYGIKFPVRGRVFDEDMMVDVADFAINSLKDNKFFSAYKGRTYCIDDFVYFYFCREAFKDILQQMYDKGFEDGKKVKIKSKYSVTNIEEK